MGFQKPYKPIIKKRGFDPSPVAGNIPIYADSKSNPKCVGTAAYNQFWEEQIDRCINGYKTGGLHIPGRYYYYLNFIILQGLKGPMYPLFVDLDLEYFRLIDYVKENKKTGIIAPKARRKGLSEKVQGGVLGHGIRFIEGYRGGIAAGLERYQKGLRDKFDKSQARMIDEFQLNSLESNEKSYKIGYQRRDPVVGFVDDGFGGHLTFETMYDKAEKMEGEYFHDVVFEESGQFPLLSATFESIKPALMFGSEMLGTFYIYGTGGNILSTSKDFKKFWDQSDFLGLERFWVPGERMMHPFFGNKISEKFSQTDEATGKHETFDAIPNLRHLQKWQRIGCEDTEAAKEWILKKRVEYSKLPDKSNLKKHNQSFPITVEEAFTSGGSNNFNDEKIYDQLFKVEGDTGLYKKVILEWVYDQDENGNKKLKSPLEVTARPAKKGDKEGHIIWVYQTPRKDILDLDIGGVDGYNQDQTQDGTSLGAMTVVRQGDKVNMEDEGIHRAQYPVCLYYQRPARKEMFYDNCLKISVWYNLKKNTMINAEQDFVIDYYNRNNGKLFLAPRPRSFDAPKTSQMHKYGAKMTGYSKPMILGVTQSWVEDYVQFCMFPELLRDLLAYDEEYVGTDWDSVDALAYAIMRIQDMRTRPRKNSDIESGSSDMPEWMFDAEGNAILLPNNSESKGNKRPTTENQGGWTSGISDFRPKRTEVNDDQFDFL